MIIPFGKHRGNDVSMLGYHDLPYMNWMLSIDLTTPGLRGEVECHILTLEQQLEDLAHEQYLRDCEDHMCDCDTCYRFGGHVA